MIKFCSWWAKRGGIIQRGSVCVWQSMGWVLGVSSGFRWRSWIWLWWSVRRNYSPSPEGPTGVATFKIPYAPNLTKVPTDLWNNHLFWREKYANIPVIICQIFASNHPFLFVKISMSTQDLCLHYYYFSFFSLLLHLVILLPEDGFHFKWNGVYVFGKGRVPKGTQDLCPSKIFFFWWRKRDTPTKWGRIEGENEKI